MKNYVFIFPVALIVFITSCANYYLPTGSMEPTILLGDQLFASTINFKPVKRGDIVIFKEPVDGKEYIKRCVAVEGDIFDIKQGALYVNGNKLDESYIRGETRNDQGARFISGTVPPGMIYVLGDNRENSSDSRHFGFISVDKVIGKPFLIYGNKLKSGRETVWVK